MTMSVNVDGRPWYREPWPWILMAGPVLVIIAAVVTIWIAVVSNDGLVTDDYYKEGLAVNQRLQRDQQASDLGVRADVMKSGKSLRLVLKGGEKLALPEAINLKLAHPTMSGQDQVVVMTSQGQGFYVGELGADISGRWLVSIEDPMGQWRVHSDWRVDQDALLQLHAGAH